MQALILAAGRGSRLGDRSGGVSKCLLEVGQKPLIEHQIDALAACGVGPVGMVVGFAADEVEEIVGMKAEYIRNPRWSVTNSLYSFGLARDWIKGDFIVLNCDVLFTPRIVERLLEMDGDAIAYDSSSGERREQMSVHVVDGRLADMSKILPVHEVSGENVGILRFTHETGRLLFARAEELIAQGREKDWLGAAVREVAKTRPIRAVDIRDLPWCEIDFPADLHKARKTVWPAIRREERRVRAPFRIAKWAAAVMFATLFGFTTYSAWFASNEAVWESAAVSGAEAAIITDGKRSRESWMLRKGGSASLTSEGPTTLRISTRPVFMAESAGKVDFILEILIDGRKVAWHAASQEISNTWRHEGRKLGKRDRFEVHIPPGKHEVTVTLSATNSVGCLMHFAQLMDDI